MKKVTINIDEHLNKLGIKKLKDHQKTIINSFLRKKIHLVFYQQDMVEFMLYSSSFNEE